MGISQKLGIYAEEYKTLDETVQDLFNARKAELMRALARTGYIDTSVAVEKLAELTGSEMATRAKLLKQKKSLEEAVRQEAKAEELRKAREKNILWGDIASIVGGLAGTLLAKTGVGTPLGLALLGASLGGGALGAKLKSDYRVALAQEQLVEQQLRESEIYLQEIMQQLSAPSVSVMPLGYERDTDEEEDEENSLEELYEYFYK